MHLILLLPDGIGVRHFLYTDFIHVLHNRGHRVTVWADKPVLEQIDDERVQTCQLPPIHATTRRMDLCRTIWQMAQLRWQAHAQQDETYGLYMPKKPKKGLKNKLKWYVASFLARYNASLANLQSLRKSYYDQSVKTAYYHACAAQLIRLRADMVFCSHQRATRAVAPMLAAQAHKIPAISFIFSWDNLPKATLLAPADHYFLWSNHMRAEMLRYHPEIIPDRQHVTGTPQFQPYFDARHLVDRHTFCARYHLDPDKIWLCFTGDDRTTSPHDPVYLQHLAAAVVRLNQQQNDRFRILFRRCPVDWSDRYDAVLNQYNHLIYNVAPQWLRQPESNGTWQHIMPTREDVALLVQTVAHSALTINIGSTTALDFAVLGKPACYLRYNAVEDETWDIHKVYRYIHFRSMDGLQPVYWIDHPHEMDTVLLQALHDAGGRVEQARTWHTRIVCHPLDTASTRMVVALEQIQACTSAT